MSDVHYIKFLIITLAITISYLIGYGIGSDPNMRISYGPVSKATLRYSTWFMSIIVGLMLADRYFQHKENVSDSNTKKILVYLAGGFTIFGISAGALEIVGNHAKLLIPIILAFNIIEYMAPQSQQQS